MIPKETGRPAYHPSAMLKLYIYGYLNRIQSTRRLERETGRNIELMWLHRIRAFAIKHADLVHHLFQCPFKFPSFIRWVVIVWRNGNGHIDILGGVKQSPQVGDCIVFGHAGTYDSPGHTIWTQKVNLRVSYNQCGSLQVKNHI